MANKKPLVIETTLADAFSNLQKADIFAWQIDVAAAAPRAALAVTDNAGSDAFSVFVSQATSGNIFLGSNAANGTMTGAFNIGLGRSNGNALTSGGSNIMIGLNAGQDINSGSNNVCVGVGAGANITTGGANFALGTSALSSNLTGTNNVSIGSSSGSLSTGSLNMFIGTNAGAVITTANGNVMIGNNAGNNASQLATAASSIAIGINTWTGGSTSIALGPSATTTGTDAIAIGNAATAAANNCTIGGSSQVLCSIVGGLTVNDAGGDFDTRIEGDTATNLFVCDAGLDAVQIGDTVPGSIADFRSTVTVFNETGTDKDFRVEGDTCDHMIFAEGNAASENIALLAASLPNWQSMDRGMFVGNATTVPTGNPTDGAFLYAESGTLKLRTSGGTVRDLSTDASGGGLVLTSTKTADYTAVNGDHVLVDTNGAAGDVTIQLPATPSNDHKVAVTLITDHATRIVDFDRNGSTINGAADNAPRYNLVLEGDTVFFHYVGGDTGWLIADNTIKPHAAELRRDAAQSISHDTDTKVAFDAEAFDIGGIADLTNDWFLVRRSGLYAVSSFWGKSGAFDSGERALTWVRKFTGASSTSADNRLVYFTLSPAAAQSLVSVQNSIIECNAGDKIEMWIQQTTGGSQNTATEVVFRPTMAVTEMR